MVDLDSSTRSPAHPGDCTGAAPPLEADRYSPWPSALAPVARFMLDGREITVHRWPTTALIEAPTWRALRHACIGSAHVAGERYLLAALATADAATASDEDAHGDPADVLTCRELQVVALVAAGRSNKEIAGRLHISEWTVSTHLRRIFAKLRVDNRAAMVFRCAGRIDFAP